MIKLDYLKTLSVRSKVRVDSDELEAILSAQEDASLISPGVEAHYYRFLYRLARETSPALMLELGTHTGISSACLAEGNPNGHVITVNNKPELLERLRRPNVLYVMGDSLTPVGLPGMIDLLFIDTDHDGIRCGNEFDLYKDLVDSDGVVFFDDITLNRDMVAFWENFNPAGWDKLELGVHGAAGFGALVRKT